MMDLSRLSRTIAHHRRRIGLGPVFHACGIDRPVEPLPTSLPGAAGCDRPLREIDQARYAQNQTSARGRHAP